jgi:hypothetical protein
MCTLRRSEIGGEWGYENYTRNEWRRCENYTRNGWRRCKTTLETSGEDSIHQVMCAVCGLCTRINPDAVNKLNVLKQQQHARKTTLEASGELRKSTLETSGEIRKSTLETSGVLPTQCPLPEPKYQPSMYDQTSFPLKTSGEDALTPPKLYMQASTWVLHSFWEYFCIFSTRFECIFQLVQIFDKYIK